VARHVLYERVIQVTGQTVAHAPDDARSARPPDMHQSAVATYGVPLRLRLLGSFDLRVGSTVVTLPLNVRRLLALLAVRERPQSRASVAYTLWMDTTQARAAANLRSTLWKLGSHRERFLHSEGEQLGLTDEVEVDFIQVVARARQLIGPDPDLAVDEADVDQLGDELLPDWDEEWLTEERERLRQLRVHALEALCSRLGNGGRGAEAVCAGQAAVAAEPLRESAQRLLITAHLAEGNVSEAHRQFEIYSRLLWDHLQLPPSPQMKRLLAGALHSRD
jgi:DNA-binding SARP family transcriptional activator